jgi:hypothetical protein
VANHPTHDVVAVHVTDNHERRVVRYVVAPVVAEEILPSHRLQVTEPADGRMRVGMYAECGSSQLLIEQLIGIVLSPLQLRDDDRAFRLAVRGIVKTVRHPLGFDEEHAIEHIPRRCFRVRGLIDPRIPIPVAAELFDDAFHLVAWDVRRPLEVHVLDPVRHSGEPGAFVLGADPIPAPHRRERRRPYFLNEHAQAVVEQLFVHVSECLFGGLHHRHSAV